MLGRIGRSARRATLTCVPESRPSLDGLVVLTDPVTQAHDPGAKIWPTVLVQEGAYRLETVGALVSRVLEPFAVR